MAADNSADRELKILESIEADPNATQAKIAADLSLAVGTVNFVIKRLVKKGYVRVKQLERRRLKYMITPAGIALRTRLALDALGYSMRLYRETRATAKRLVTQAMRLGYAAVSIRGQGELAEVVQLTCLEMGMRVAPGDEALGGPTIMVVGTRLQLQPGDPTERQG